MSYLQIEIGPLKKDAKGVDIPGSNLRGLKFNQLAHVEYLTISAGSKNNVLYSYALVYAGLYANCIAKREEPDFTFENVCDWVDKITDEKVFENILAVYKSTLPEVPEDVKKKVAKKNLQQKNIKRKVLK